MTTPPQHMLIVEDNQALAENVVEILADLGYEAVPVGSAEEALPLLEQEPIGVITDLRLPGMSGVDFVAEMRRRGCVAPVILITAFAEEATVLRAEELGVLDVLPKPINFQRLFELVAEVVGPRRRVLVLEDSPALASNIAEALSEVNLEPIVVGTVQAALEQKQLPRVAIVDVRLPDGSGMDVARRLRARDPKLEVLVVTGFPTDLDDSASAARAEPGLHIMQKPIAIEQLIEQVRAVSDPCRTPEH